MKIEARTTNGVNGDTQTDSNACDEVIRRIASAISGVRFGSVGSS